MRTFYVFYINKEFKILTKENPYNLYKALENIYYLGGDELSLGINLFEQMAIPFKKNDVNTFIFDNFKDNDFYTMNRNKHKMYNKYRDETLNIETHFTYIKLTTNINKKSVFEKIYLNPNLFVCDFKNKDYFWVDKILSYN